MARNKLDTTNWHLYVALIGISAVAAYLALVITSTINQGFDFTDEGFYLLTLQRNYNPEYILKGWFGLVRGVFFWIEFDIIKIRWLKFILTLVTTFIYSIAIWVALRENQQSKVTGIHFFLIMGLVAIASMMAYCLLPLSPSYNDITQYIVFCSLGFAVMSTLSQPPFHAKIIPLACAFIAGSIAFGVLISKLSVAPILFSGLLLMIVGFGYLFKIPQSRILYNLFALAGGVAFSGALAVASPEGRHYIVNLPEAFRLWRIMPTLGYDDSSLMMGVVDSFKWAAIVFFKALILYVIYWQVSRLIVKYVGLYAQVVSGILLFAALYFITIIWMPNEKPNYILPIGFITFYTIIHILHSYNLKGNRVAIFGLAAFLIVSPFIFSFGTNRQLVMAGFSFLAFWVTPIAAFSFRFPRAHFLVIIFFYLFHFGNLFHAIYIKAPYRQPQLSIQSTAFKYGNSTINLDKGRAVYLTQVREALTKAGYKPGDYIIGFYKISGVVYLMEGEALGGFLWAKEFYPIYCANLAAEKIDPKKRIFLIENDPPSDEIRQCMKAKGIDPDSFQRVDSVATIPETLFKNPWTYIYARIE